MEYTKSREGFHVFLYPFAGRQVNEGIATLMAYRWSQRQPITFSITANDYGVELLTSKPLEPDLALLRELLARENLVRTSVAGDAADWSARRIVTPYAARIDSLTPLSFPLWAERLRSQILSSETFRSAFSA